MIGYHIHRYSQERDRVEIDASFYTTAFENQTDFDGNKRYVLVNKNFLYRRLFHINKDKTLEDVLHKVQDFIDSSGKDSLEELQKHGI